MFQDKELLPRREARGTIETLHWKCEKEIFDVGGAEVMFSTSTQANVILVQGRRSFYCMAIRAGLSCGEM